MTASLGVDQVITLSAVSTAMQVWQCFSMWGSPSTAQVQCFNIVSESAMCVNTQYRINASHSYVSEGSAAIVQQQNRLQLRHQACIK